MINVAKISKNLIAVSLVSTALVFWLGGRYLKDAHTQFSGATQLQQSVVPETTLFEIASSLDKERAAIQRILAGTDRFADKRENLNKLATNTKSLLEQVRQELPQIRSLNAGKNQAHYGDESIEQILAELDDRLKRISVTRFVIMGQTFRPPSDRDDNVRMQLFDTYGNLNIAFNRLRKLTRTYPEKNPIDIIVAHEIKDAIWTVKDSINQTSTLLEASLLKYKSAGLDSINADNLTLRVLQQHERAADSLAYLKDMEKANNIRGQASEAVLKLVEQYETVFRPKAKLLLLDWDKDTNLDEKLERWIPIAETTKQNVDTLQNLVLTNTVNDAKAIKNNAALNLLFNTILVSLCMLMAYASFGIARKIQYQSDHDELTELPNRRYFNQALKSLFKGTDAKKEKLTLMTLDLNGFKSVNDTKGHIAGDNLLIQVANRLTQSVGPDIILARMGGDEFAVAYKTDVTEDPHAFACQLSNQFDEPFTIEDGLVTVGCSIGYSVYPDDAVTINALQITSDFAMFSAKQAGRNTIQAYDPELASKFENRIIIEKDLLAAIDNNEFELFYQPKVDLKTETVSSVEALIRWNHPTRGMVPPDQFISVAEESGLMPLMGKWIMSEACAQVASWKITKTAPIRVAVNVSVNQIAQPEFVKDVLDALTLYDIPGNSLELEITESVVMADIDWVIKSLNALKEHGIQIALDDFGTGYSSLSQLQFLPLDTLKIDRSFIDQLDDNASTTKSVTSTIASIAQILNLETVAEGIETESQLIEVKKLGIDVAQGYYYSKPVSKCELLDVIRKINSGSDKPRLAA